MQGAADIVIREKRGAPNSLSPEKAVSQPSSCGVVWHGVCREREIV